MPLLPVLCEFESSLAYIVSSRTAKTTKQNNKKQTKNLHLYWINFFLDLFIYEKICVLGVVEVRRQNQTLWRWSYG